MRDRKGRVVLQGVDRYRVMDPMFECVRVVLSHRGEAYSPAYVQGISGAAFRIGGICPCAPTCACAMDTQELIRMLGYGLEYLPLYEEGVDAEREMQRVIARVREEIRAGRPAIVWNAFTTCEWDVVCGFDDTERLFLGRGSYAGWEEYATADWGRAITCTAVCPALGAIFVGQRDGSFDARAAEVAALREAVSHAHSTENQGKQCGEEWAMLYGLLCYDRWIGDMRADPPRLPAMGDRYCLGVYRSTHRAAAAFARELAAKYPRAAGLLERAAGHFAAEADALHACAEGLFPGWQLPTEAKREGNDRAAALLQQARDRYAGGIEAIEAALQMLGG